MPVTVNYSGILAEKTGVRSEQVKKATSKAQLMERILEQHPGIRGLSFVVSRNGVIRHDDFGIAEGDSLMLIPPAPGG